MEETKEMQEWQVDPKFDWYQNATHVFVSFKIKKGDLRNSLEVSFGSEEVQLANAGVDIAKIALSNPVLAHLCTHNVGLRKIELKLKKVAENYNWPSLEAVEGQHAVAQPTAPILNTPLPAYPSSSKKKSDWAKVDKVMEKDLKADKAEGSDALNDLFKQIYGRADEATRRAMIKSYQTSGGTVLSTNWSEVATKDYEG